MIIMQVTNKVFEVFHQKRSSYILSQYLHHLKK